MDSEQLERVCNVTLATSNNVTLATSNEGNSRYQCDIGSFVHCQ